MSLMAPEPLASVVTALLGPTNTGKTHRAIERLLEHDSGMIGLPLRLLAREVYDKVSARVGEDAVALVTGEEKRIPQRPRYWVCTVEAMPTDREVDFLAVDEVQLVEHPGRGHVFTDRLLRSRGRLETWFMGADTMAPLVRRLLPAAKIVRHSRLSELRYRGRSSIAGLPRRSAIVAFSVPQVYEIADAVRRRRGGAAVVLGALSPRARNAQVALYESGEVDYLVATDAIGMGLNLDVEHVALASLRKFDGKEDRDLEPAELGQVVGRAGRHVRNGTFGALSPLRELSPGLVRALELHQFPAVRHAFYRNHELDMSSIGALRASLRVPPRLSSLRMVQSSDDLAALERLCQMPDIIDAVRGEPELHLLWAVCQIPDFRKLLPDHHAMVLAEIFLRLARSGPLDDDWLDERVSPLESLDGDIHSLTGRLAAVRTWTYVSSHRDWVARNEHWQEKSRSLEDRLSDALHDRLVQRFVEHPGKQASRPHHRARSVSVRADESEPDAPVSGPFAKLWQLNARLKAEARGADAGNGSTWVDDLVSAGFESFEVDAHGKIAFRGRPVAHFSRGRSLVRPEVTLLDVELPPGDRLRVSRRLRAWSVDVSLRLVGALADPGQSELSPAGRGLLYQLEQGLGTVLTRQARQQIHALSTTDRERLLESDIVVGDEVVFSRASLAEASLRARAALCSAYFRDVPSVAVPEAAVACFPEVRGVGADIHARIGYPVFGGLAIRADIVENMSKVLREAAKGGPFRMPTELGLLCQRPCAELSAAIRDMGYRQGPEGRFHRRRARRRRRGGSRVVQRA